MGGLTGSAGTPPQYTGMTMPQSPNVTMTDPGDGSAPVMSTTGPVQMPTFQMTPAGKPATSGAASLAKGAQQFGAIANAMQPLMQAVVPGYQGQGVGRTQGQGQATPQPVRFQTGQMPNVAPTAPNDFSMYMNYPRNAGGY